MSEIAEIVARAMKERAAQPLLNLDSLERVPVGSLGDAWLYLALAALDALEAAGYVIVPKEPTEAMIDAADRLTQVGAIDCHTQIDLPASHEEAWRAMWAAAPKP